MLPALLANPIALLAALSPLIIKSIDGNRAKLDSASKLHDSEIKTANDLAIEIITAVDRILFLIQEAMFGIVFRELTVESLAGKPATDSDRKAWEALQVEMALWNSSRTSRLARVFGAYNDETVQVFSELAKQIEILENMVNAGFFNRTRSRYFIEDTEPKVAGSGQETIATDPDFNVEFLIDLLRIDPNELPGLVKAIREFGSGEDTPEPKRSDFRYKFVPVHNNCKKDLLRIGALMFTQIQAAQVGALRSKPPSFPGSVPPLRANTTTPAPEPTVAAEASRRATSRRPAGTPNPSRAGATPGG